MEKKDILYIILGCFGYSDDGFVLCNSVENKIFTLSSDFYYFKEVMTFLDNCKLFDKPLYDNNAIKSFLLRFREKFELPTSPVWVERKFINYQKFTIDHRNCGVYLKLILADNIIKEGSV